MSKELFERDPGNPLLTVEDLPYRANAVFNAGAVEMAGYVVLLMRVEDRHGRSHLTVARSKNGVDGWQIENQPLIQPDQQDGESVYEEYGCEDARVTHLPELGLYAICYTAFSPNGPGVAIATTRDFASVCKMGLILHPNNKDAALFPHRFDGRWAVLHRPDAGGIEHIWSAYSPDLIHWGEPHCVLPEGDGAAWDAVKVGAGPPPILTEHGWLLVYHGVKGYGGHLIYRVGVAMLEG